MKTYSQKLPPSKSRRIRTFNWLPTARGEGILEIRGAKASDRYRVAEFPCHEDFDGRAFSIVKDDGEAYDVLISNRRAEWDSCDCPGFTYKSVCKHRQSLRAILESDWLVVPEPRVPDAEQRAEASRVVAALLGEAA
jgi:hypothetical protein